MAARSAAPAAGAQPDAPAGNWVDRSAPASWRPWLRLSRIDRPIGTWLLLLPCWWGIGLAMIAHGPGWRALWIAVACGIGAVVMRGAGCTWNDLTDRDIDAKVERTRIRPLPSGRVTARGAFVWLVVQCLIGFALLLTLGPAAIWLGVLSLIPVAIYPFAKRFTWWPQVFLGIAFNWGAMLAYAAHAGRLEAPAVILWLAGICWTLVYDTIYAHQDIEDDELIGVKSTARRFGDNSLRWLSGFAVASVAGIALAIVMAGPESALAWGLALGGLAGFAVHLAWQLRQFRPRDGELALRLFRSNRDAGLILALFLASAGLV
ncbi:4-hydroxybenzoate octaprenyltransferase [Paracoccus sp. S-4012]|uniref:4-hydroxybenzoate octaprenyltransferase n=1 Tax=Paracoccus sp. S-4012 TaxID=2665648 RepID=UPI0012B0B3B6|nr:4-hydroxybenzoate octaprenyltransferase [Paracoccus sp. S-4012]MRX49097.1 4-hydroxybenzoate octaprenyltransferase [Paracoccus sp. S-4012]